MHYRLKEIINDVINIDDAFRQHDIKEIVDFQMFEQTWSSTALGFDVMWAGQAITKAMTTVIQDIKGVYYVFFGGHLAYSFLHPKEKFFEDLNRKQMADVKTANEIY